MGKGFLRLSMVVVCTLLAGLDARGAVIAYDGFEYATPGNLNGKNGGVGFGANAWTLVSGQGDPTLASGSLTYADGSNRTIEANGNKVAPANTSRSTRNLDAVEAVANRTIWVSFRETLTGAAAVPSNHAGISLFSGTNGTGTELFLGKPGSASNWGVDTSTQAAAVASGTIVRDAFLLTRITYGATTGTVEMWVNPTLDAASLGTPTVTSSEAAFNIASLRVSTGADASNFQFDELRIADTFAEAVPEPTGVGAVVVGVGLLLRRRRRDG